MTIKKSFDGGAIYICIARTANNLQVILVVGDHNVSAKRNDKLKVYIKAKAKLEIKKKKVDKGGRFGLD